MRGRITAARHLLPGLLSLLLLLSGCAVLPTRNATDSGPVPPEPVPLPEASSSSLPPRPFDLPLRGVDPCGVLTERQRAALGFDRDPLPGVEEGFDDAGTCSYRNSRAKVGARIALITEEGVNVWTSDTAQVKATPVKVEGFPALVIRTPGLRLACNVAVDVAGGQHLSVLYRDDGAQSPASLDQLCAGARRVAAEAVRSLQEKSGTATDEPG
ncbi:MULTISPECIES: DUF3558 domain-containing protein [Actinopolyspora]|uniref:DUF3558 domain-containing protein n=1 Tax=Actinopolyspora saharensis TaxID=995062 RepID=A0A1H1EE12_9ACTN|nr:MULTISPECIES: DUF3558 domain-containing protein [Actinopolyspora]NHD19055.1 DUF3558 domain-containing protein [Actinopolyspora sp. BKK2]NHE78160.1 DUF3558 domain-containing protein [Actinopolyspora sp. BKK1]SDQ87015.1 Protein of unknown function [Actinopolyspora saharensis]